MDEEQSYQIKLQSNHWQQSYNQEQIFKNHS